MNAPKILNSFLAASVFILSSMLSCIKQDSPIEEEFIPGIEAIADKSDRYSLPVTMTDMMFIQGDMKESMKAGVKIDSIYINLKGEEWRLCEQMGEGMWWIRNICRGEDLRDCGKIHLHNFTIRLIGHGVSTGSIYSRSQKVIFFQVTPGAYNEYIFNITADYTINVGINPEFGGNINTPNKH